MMHPQDCAAEVAQRDDGYIQVSLFSREEIYRPIWEEDAAPLEVQIGCGWHRCKFCDFANDPLRVFSLPEIDVKAQMLASVLPDASRVFLLGENPFMLPCDMLLDIFDIVADRFPKASQISMYSRFDDVLRKTDEELETLVDNGLTQLHIGLESGSQEVLDLFDKGIRIENALEACRRLHAHGIKFSFTMIAGLGGKQLSAAHAKESAAFLNEAQPQAIWVTGLLVWPDTPLAQMVAHDEFRQLTFRERLEEIRAMVADMEMRNCTFVDSTVLGTYTLQAELPSQKQPLLTAMDHLLSLPGGDEIAPMPDKTAPRAIL
ncbi:MAG: radical SAM protein [Eggerthellaceae bacterium]|nr:radical SAM protein [Eggerthellaceae bacterium]